MREFKIEHAKICGLTDEQNAAVCVFTIYRHSPICGNTLAVYTALQGIIVERACASMQFGKENKYAKYFISSGVAYAVLCCQNLTYRTLIVASSDDEYAAMYGFWHRQVCSSVRIERR